MKHAVRCVLPMLRVLSSCDSYPIVCSGTYHDSRHQGANEGLLYSIKGIWPSYLLPLPKKTKIKFPSKCLLTYILIPVLSSSCCHRNSPQLCNGCVVVAKEKKKWNCLMFICHRSIILILSTTVHSVFLVVGRGGTKGYFWVRKGNITMVMSRTASMEGTQSTVFSSLISSAALFFFLCDYSYVNYART